MYDSSAALDALASLPPEPVKRDRSAWGAVWRGVAKTGAELFSQAERAGQIEGMPSRRAADDPIEQERQRSRMRRAEGVAAADRFALEMRPDPASASEAEKIVFGLSSGLSKAVALTATLGGLPGAAAFGLSEGESMYRDMRRQGVDEGTALKVAGVTGAAGAAGIALPLVGSTVPRTLGLYLAGGPGGFVAQQAATSAILKEANYGEIAKQFDPLDPVGLAVSALVPLPFVALGVRRNMRAAAAPEAVDAAMVHNLSTLADQHAVQQAAGDAGAPIVPAPQVAKTTKQTTTPEADVSFQRMLAEQEDGARWVSASKLVAGKPDQAVAQQMQEAVIRAGAIARETPDVQVRTDEAGRVWTAADEMAEARRLAAEGTDAELGTLDADLVRVAAECALSL